jgi:hypothetical protein
LERGFSLDVLLHLKWSIYEYLLVNNKYSYCSIDSFSCHEACLKFTRLQATKEAGADMKGAGVGFEEVGAAMEAGMGMKGAGVPGILVAGVMVVVEGEEWEAAGKGTEERC